MAVSKKHPQPKLLERHIDWSKRRDIPVTILAWLAVIGIVFWSFAHVGRSVLIVLIAAFIAYALFPLVKFLQRLIPRTVAILVVYIIVFSLIGVFLYFVVSTANVQLRSLAHNVQGWLTPQPGHQDSPAFITLKNFGLSQEQLSQISSAITSQAEQLTHSILPFLTGVFSSILDMLLVAVISIYLLIDGSRSVAWLRRNTPHPQRVRVTFVVDTLERIVGGYIRGQIIIALIVGVLISIGLSIFHVPYAIFLGLLSFVLEFIPIIGTIVSGAICVLLALTQGWLTAVFVLIYFIVMHVIEGDILGPRIVGKAIGLSPLVSIIALLIGTELYGIVGALFASPIAGVAQALLVTFWSEWKASHPEQFSKVQQTFGRDLSRTVKSPVKAKKRG